MCFDKYAVIVDKDDLVDALQQSSWIEHIKLKNELLASLNVADNRLYVDSQCVDAYFSAFVADYVRANMLNIVHQFTIETVLSDYRKLDYINLAKKLG